MSFNFGTIMRHRPHLRKSKFYSVLAATAFSAHVLQIYTVVKYFFRMPHVPGEMNRWVKSYNGNAPPDTLVGGHDINGEPIYVARASHNGDLIPGKLVASQYCTYVSWGGLEFKKYDYEVLVDSSNNWIATRTYHVPDAALPGGITDIGDTLYIGRVRFNGSITTGKVHQAHGICYIPFDGKELSFYDYEVLTY